MKALPQSLVQRPVNYLSELIVHCGREKRNKRMWGNEMTAVSPKVHYVYEIIHVTHKHQYDQNINFFSYIYYCRCHITPTYLCVDYLFTAQHPQRGHLHTHVLLSETSLSW